MSRLGQVMVPYTTSLGLVLKKCWMPICETKYNPVVTSLLGVCGSSRGGQDLPVTDAPAVRNRERSENCSPLCNTLSLKGGRIF